MQPIDVYGALVKQQHALNETIAPLEKTSQASAAHSVGTQLIYNGVLYDVTTNIAVGDTLTVGTNISIADDITTQISSVNEALTNKIDGVNANAFANGAVNLLPNTATSQVYNGVTYTVNSDGSVSTSGTASANSGLDIEVVMNGGSILDSELYNKISGKQLKLTGCPSGGADNTFYLAFNRIDNADHSATDTGNGVTFDFTKTTTTGKCYVTIYVYSGVNMNGKTFKPMLTLADVPNSDYNHYVPYAKSNKELTEYVVPSDVTFTATDSTVAYLDQGTFFQVGNVVMGTVGFIVKNVTAGTAVSLGTLNVQSSETIITPCCNSYGSSDYAGTLYFAKNQNTLQYYPNITSTQARVSGTIIFKVS